MRKRSIYGQRRSRSACASAQSDQGLHCPLTESSGTIKCINGKREFAKRLCMREMNLNLCICRLLEDTFSLGATYICFLMARLYNVIKRPILSAAICIVKLFGFDRVELNYAPFLDGFIFEIGIVIFISPEPKALGELIGWRPPSSVVVIRRQSSRLSNRNIFAGC